jgi:hypothetical protein
VHHEELLREVRRLGRLAQDLAEQIAALEERLRAGSAQAEPSDAKPRGGPVKIPSLEMPAVGRPPRGVSGGYSRVAARHPKR